MKKMLSLKRIYLLALFPVSFLLIFIAKRNNFFSEQIYALHIYKWLSQAVSFLSGLFPFSIAELLIMLLPVVLLIIILRFVILIIFDKQARKDRMIKGIINVLCTVSTVFFLFTMLGGLNYYRYSFVAYSNLEVIDSSVEELYQLTQSLTREANDLRAQITPTDKNGVFQLSMSNTELAKEAQKAYEALAQEYPVLEGSYAAPKPVLLSKLMSQTEIAGIFFPFTMEANVNIDIPDYSIPSTMLHELAHLHGFMREDEANYLAYLAGMKSDKVELKYSSTMLALIVAGNALYDKSPELYTEIREQYSEGVISDIQANSVYWQKYEDTVVSTISNKVNDTYLKANAQSDGVQSYGRMLDLLLAKHRKEQSES